MWKWTVGDLAACSSRVCLGFCFGPPCGIYPVLAKRGGPADEREPLRRFVFVEQGTFVRPGALLASLESLSSHVPYVKESARAHGRPL